jgi:hypothetical protein
MLEIQSNFGGTGSRFSNVVIILTGVAALFATLVTVVLVLTVLLRCSLLM